VTFLAEQPTKFHLAARKQGGNACHLTNTSSVKLKWLVMYLADVRIRRSTRRADAAAWPGA
jgi:hypothetical protein